MQIRWEAKRDRPSLGSAIDGPVYHGIQVGSQPAGVDPRSPPRRIGNHCPRHEPTRRNGPELGDRHSVPRDDNRLSCLNLPQYRTGVVA